MSDHETLTTDGDDLNPYYEELGLTSTQSAPRRRRRVVWVSALCILLALCVGGVVGGHYYVVARGKRTEAKEIEEFRGQANISSWPEAKQVLDDQAEALLRGDEQAWLHAVDPRQPELMEAYRRMYSSARALGVTEWAYNKVVPPVTTFAESELDISVLSISYCMSGWTCPGYGGVGELDQPFINIDIKMRRINGTSGRYVITYMDTSYLKSSTVSQPTPWETPLVFAEGKRVIVGAPPSLASRLPEVVAAADKAAAVDDRYATMLENPQQRYRIFVAGDKEWGTWYTPNPAHAIAYASAIGNVGQNVVLHIDAIDKDRQTLRTVLQHEMGHVVTLSGTDRSSDAVWNVDQWLIEGIAEYIAKSPSRNGDIQAGGPVTTIMLDPTSDDSSDLEVSRLYGVGHLAATCMATSYGEKNLMKFIQLRLRQGQSYDAASRTAFGQPFLKVDQHCVDYIHRVAGLLQPQPMKCLR